MQYIGGLFELLILATAGIALLYYSTICVVVGVGLLFGKLFKWLRRCMHNTINQTDEEWWERQW
jgi:hypothetical protein